MTLRIEKKSFITKVITALAAVVLFMSFVPSNKVSAETDWEYYYYPQYKEVKGTRVPENGLDGFYYACREMILLKETDTVIGIEGEETWYLVSGRIGMEHSLTIKGEVHLVLRNGSILAVMPDEVVGTDRNNVNAPAGIIVEEGDSLYITNQYSKKESYGEIYASGANYVIDNSGTTEIISGGAAIGSSAGKKSGKIVIDGGSVELRSGYDAAALGSGAYGESGEIIINGGYVKCNDGISEGSGAGIGTGIQYEKDPATTETIIINGGKVLSNGKDGGAAIGGGKNSGASKIIINGGDVNARGGYKASGIGGGENGFTGTVVIGGTVFACKDVADSVPAIGNGSSKTDSIILKDHTYIGIKRDRVLYEFIEPGDITKEFDTTYYVTSKGPLKDIEISFDMQGHGVQEEKISTLSTLSFTLPVPEDDGDYEFAGWYSNPEYTGKSISGNVSFSENTVLYARWYSDNDIRTYTDFVNFMYSDDPERNECTITKSFVFKGEILSAYDKTVNIAEGVVIEQSTKNNMFSVRNSTLTFNGDGTIKGYFAYKGTPSFQFISAYNSEVIFNGVNVSGFTSSYYNEDGNYGVIKATNSSITINSGTFADCGDEYYQDYGGLIYANASDVVINGGYFYGLKAVCGGAIYAEDSRVTINGGKFVKCFSKICGGAVDVLGGSFEMNGGEFVECESKYGGALELEQAYYATITNGLFSGCHASESGGAISIYSSTLLLNKENEDDMIIISDCSSDYEAGAISVSGALRLDDGTAIYGNHQEEGAAIYVNQDSYVALMGDVYVKNICSDSSQKDIAVFESGTVAPVNGFTTQDKIAVCSDNYAYMGKYHKYDSNAFTLSYYDDEGERVYYDGDVLEDFMPGYGYQTMEYDDDVIIMTSYGISSEPELNISNPDESMKVEVEDLSDTGIKEYYQWYKAESYTSEYLSMDKEYYDTFDKVWFDEDKVTWNKSDGSFCAESSEGFYATFYGLKEGQCVAFRIDNSDEYNLNAYIESVYGGKYYCFVYNKENDMFYTIIDDDYEGVYNMTIYDSDWQSFTIRDLAVYDYGKPEKIVGETEAQLKNVYPGYEVACKVKFVNEYGSTGYMYSYSHEFEAALEGNNQTISRTELNDIEFHFEASDAEFDYFEEFGDVYIDGLGNEPLVKNVDYTFEKGSIKIVLSKEILSLLGDGKHTISVVKSENGIVSADFSITVPLKIIQPDNGRYQVVNTEAN